jgi:hypothetical protein
MEKLLRYARNVAVLQVRELLPTSTRIDTMGTKTNRGSKIQLSLLLACFILRSQGQTMD